MEAFKIDEKDKKIIVELQNNSRASFSEIGKKVKLPKTVVAYRVKHLVDSKFIPLFCTVVSKSKFSYIQSRLFLKFHNFDDKIEERLTNFLKKKKGIHWVGSLNGCYDFCIIINSKNIEELNEIYSDIIYTFSSYILDKELSITTKSIYHPLKYVFEQNKQIIEYKRKPSKNFKITPADFKIINLIKQNSRLPLLEISQKLKLTPKTVRGRIRSLIENGVIGAFRIRINHKMLGFHHFHTFLNLSGINKEFEKEIIDFISSFPSTIHIVKGTGKYDLEFESLLKSHFELYEIINQIKNKFPKNIQHADSALIYKIYDINTVKYE